jgi:hypothetical protein
MQLNPEFFRIVYTEMLNGAKTAKNVSAALAAIDGYLTARAETVFAPVIEHLRDVGEARSATEIEHYFARNFGVEGITGVCEYLADQGIIGKAPLPVRLTKRSNVDVDELAFFYATKAADGE